MPTASTPTTSTTMAKIPKRVREEAALICAIAASDPAPEHRRPCYDFDLAMSLGLWRGDINKTAANPSVRLALDAWEYAHDRLGWTQETDAEAEALLRCGWEP
jgi:hypothetical protein